MAQAAEMYPMEQDEQEQEQPVESSMEDFDAILKALDEAEKLRKEKQNEVEHELKKKKREEKINSAIAELRQCHWLEFINMDRILQLCHREHTQQLDDLLRHLYADTLEDIVQEAQELSPADKDLYVSTNHDKLLKEQEKVKRALRQAALVKNRAMSFTLKDLHNEEEEKVRKQLTEDALLQEKKEEAEKEKHEKARELRVEHFKSQLFLRGEPGTAVTKQKAAVKHLNWAEKILVSVICDEVQPKIQEAAEAACQGCLLDRPSQREHDCLKDTWDDKVEFYLWDAVGMTSSQRVMDTWVSILQRYPHGPTDMQACHMVEDVLSLELMLNLNQNLLDAVQILLHTDDVFTTSPPPPPPPPPPSPEANEQNEMDGPMHLSDLNDPIQDEPLHMHELGGYNFV